MNTEVLKMDPRFTPDIKAGRKTMTIREGQRDHYVEGPMQVVDSDGDKYMIEVTKVQFKWMDELTSQDARDDGYEDVHELRQVLLRYYPDISLSSTVTLVYFTYIGEM